MKQWLGLVTISAVSSLSAAAFAETGGSVDDPKIDGAGASYTVEFVDDALNALGQDTLIPRIVVRPRPPRTTLIRPRTSFVTELLKSADST
jgi:hypothetical protein